MYRHILVPIDCSEASLRHAKQVARFVAPLVPSRLMIVAAVTPTEDAGLRGKRRRHALTALEVMHRQLLQEGIWCRMRVVEGNDHAAAFALEAENDAERYDLFVLGTYQTRTEDYDTPCTGSFADQLCAKTNLPVLILPNQYAGWQ